MSVKHFIETINAHGGLSYSNNYDVEWVFPTVSNENTSLTDRLNEFGFELGLGGSTTSIGDQEEIVGGDIFKTDVNSKGMVIKYFCDEAQLPSISAATGQITGRFLGEGQVNYPHTKLYTDFQLGWICDADMTPLKFLNLWYGTIFGEYDVNGNYMDPNNGKSLRLSSQKDAAGEGNNILNERTIRLNYPDQYLAKCIITKTEKGRSASNSRGSMSYTLLDVFPYSIDAVPLSYGTSQATKVTGNFYYSKHTISYNNISNYSG
ncbi:hypothetical protein S-PM2d204 [Synechococcus phage S-PM2]|uniref:Hypothetical-Protein / belonging to T4-LIKE GC: 10 n=1 Tax=Synechococcus phage S-PM2 TaxID=238854 RepID=Q5GQD3_BPSYP|nr:Hypothetical-Protein / belonging to T4-LIKE GC: 10 [Synechococcus phage S-PM2]CAF34269.1 Hypothetical-Protein / belonging to T4-LIKE GC: 10 [Synechococcus phage S-PM2]CFW42428.1 hypothetical protein S-PM2d204 [Synechococcus phage S-PM2]